MLLIHAQQEVNETMPLKRKPSWSATHARTIQDVRLNQILNEVINSQTQVTRVEASHRTMRNEHPTDHGYGGRISFADAGLHRAFQQLGSALQVTTNQHRIMFLKSIVVALF